MITGYEHKESVWDAMAATFSKQVGPCPECWDDVVILTSDHERFTECGKCYVEWAHFVHDKLKEVNAMCRDKQREFIASALAGERGKA